MGSSEELQKKLSQEFDKMKTIQKELQKAITAKQTLEGQLSENEIVQKELEFLTPENKVYKMTGPVLVVQSIEEAKQNVEKRILFIKQELKRNDEMVKDFGSKQDKQQEALQRLQKEFAETQLKGIKKE